MIEYKDGIHLKGTGLWFDSKKKTGLSFISSADTEKFAAPEKIIATPETIRLLGNKVRKAVLLTCPYNRPFTLGNSQVELIPSGHMLGSAQMIVDKGDKTLIYAGDIWPGKLPTAKPLSIRPCDVLVLKCCTGPELNLPSTTESLELLTIFIEKSFSLNAIPIISVSSLGIGQDLIKLLGDMGHKLILHTSIHQVTKIYESFGINFGDYELLKQGDIEDRVVIAPHEKIDSDELKKIKVKRIGIISESGWEYKMSENDSVTYFDFSNKAGYEDLIKYVDQVSPAKVYLIDKYANDFAKTLGTKDFETIVLEKPTQLNLL
jgi:Cft2 family RNA processing exonuclease